MPLEAKLCCCSACRGRMVDHVDVDEAMVELYGLAPEQFTAARNAAATAAKDGGDARVGEAIKALWSDLWSWPTGRPHARSCPRKGRRPHVRPARAP